MEFLGEIASHILSRLSDAEIGALIVSSSALAALVNAQKQLFWYERTRGLTNKDLLVRPGANWRLIYTHLTASKGGHARGTSHLDTMKVYLELFPDSTLSRSDMSEITKADVLEYVLDEGLITTDVLAPSTDRIPRVARIIHQIIANTMKLDPEEALLMVDVAETRGFSVTSEAIASSIRSSQLSAYRTLAASRPDLLDSYENARTGIESNNIQTLKYMLSLLTDAQRVIYRSDLLEFALKGRYDSVHVPYPASYRYLLGLRDTDQAYLKSVYSDVKEKTKAEIIQILIDKGLQLKPAEWRQLATSAIKTDRPEVLAPAIEYWNPSTPTNQLLLKAATQKDVTCLEILLADPRIDPTVNLRAVLDKTRWMTHIRALAQHPKVTISSMDKDTRLHMYFSQINWLSQPEKYIDEIENIVSAPDAYWKIVAFLILKEPTAEQLLDYIRDNLLTSSQPLRVLSVPEVREALTAVLDTDARYFHKAAPIRALILFLIYPELTVEESTEYLREDDEYSERSIRESNMLIELVKRHK